MVKRSAIIGFAAAMFISCGGSVPEKTSGSYSGAIRSFYVGLAALDVGDDRRAREELQKVTSLAPGEPAGWNNLGVLQLRQRDLENARRSLDEAARIEPGLTIVRLNQAMLAIQQGDSDRAAEGLNKALELEPIDRRAVYLLADLHEREANEAEALALYRRIAESLPKNLAAKLEVVRLEAKLSRDGELKGTVADVEGLSGEFSAEAREQFDELKTAVEKTDTRAVATQVSFLRNVLLREKWFRDAIAEFKPSDTSIGMPIYRPLRLAAPDFNPAEPDSELGFSPSKIAEGKALFAKPVFLNGDDPPVAVWSNGKNLHIGNITLPVSAEMAEQVAIFDFDYDFRNDLAVASKAGFKLFSQQPDGWLADVTSKTKLPADVLSGSYTGVWPLDVEHDGDLDLLLSRENGPPIVLQNNSDGSFTAISPFKEITNVRDFAYADIDEDGDSDAIFLTDDGALRVFTNERGGHFKERTAPEIEKVGGFAVGDISGDGKLDIVALSGSLYRITDRDDGKNWEVIVVLELVPETVCGAGGDSNSGSQSLGLARCRIFVGDLDNNGANDIIVSDRAEAIALATGSGGNYRQLGELVAVGVSGIAEMTGDGKLDLVGIDAEGFPTLLTNQSSKNYHWQIFRPRAGKTEGDQRVNTFGIGGEMEVRTGIRTQKQLITAPQVHFGLGEARTTDVLRIIWNNGFVQAEFDLESDQAIAAEQRLKGSCPHLFTWNGERFVMVKDAPPWSPALGLKINAQETFGILQTEEWFRVPGEMLKPKDGAYELRITGEYWESFYLDNYRLLVVDHPENTEVYTDERFAVPPPPLMVFTTETTVPLDWVIDQNGKEVTKIVSALDEVYLDTFEKGKFQGVAQDHWVEFTLPADVPSHRQLLLVADGWLYPTDASINVQLGQSSFTPPRSLSLEVSDGNGGWRTAKENLGFPAGKMKSVLIELPQGHRQFRLRTNMEIYWDRLAWAPLIIDYRNTVTPVEIGTAELRYRGFSVIEKPNASSPEKPVYDQILTTGQRWRDLEGYYTRFGDVKELLAGADGRMVLMNAGDELVLRFPALPDPASGYKRDFVFIGNGWIKDGDLNSVFSNTLLPLPRRETNDYTSPPSRLEDDPVYQKHRADWQNFHIRYVSADGFRDRLRQPNASDIR